MEALTLEPAAAVAAKTPQPKRPSFRAAPLALFLLAMVPAAFIVRLISEYGVNVPFGDEWSLIPLFARWNDHQLTFYDLFRQHNEHRIFFPKLIYLAFVQWTHWNLRAEMFFSVFLCAISSACIFGLLHRTVGGGTVRRLALWAVCNVLIFSPAQAENWMWGFQLQLFIPTVCLVGALLLLLSPQLNAIRFSGACLLAIAGTFSFGNGLLLWPAIALHLLLRGSEKRWIIWWSGLGLMTLVLYFVGYELHSPPGHRSYALFDYLTYFIRFNGNALGQLPVPFRLTATAVIGSIALLLFGGLSAIFLKWRRPALGAAAPWMALGSYAIGSAVIATHGRIHEGIGQALDSRYSSISINLFIALMALLVIAAEFVGRSEIRARLSNSASAVAMIFVFLLLTWSLATLPGALIRIERMSQARVRGLANMICARVLPSTPNLRRELGIHAEFQDFMDATTILQRLALPNPPFRTSNILLDSALQSNRTTAEFGRCDSVVRKSADALEVAGHALLPAVDQPAPCVLLAYESRGQWFGFALAEVNEERPDVGRKMGRAYARSGWRYTINLSELSGDARQISAWTLDPFTGDVFKLPGVFLLPER